MTATKDVLFRDRVTNRIDRLKKLNDLNAPAVILASELVLVYRAMIITWGEGIANGFAGAMREMELQALGICVNGQCGNKSDTPFDVCKGCAEELGINETDLEEEPK